MKKFLFLVTVLFPLFSCAQDNKITIVQDSSPAPSEQKQVSPSSDQNNNNAPQLDTPELKHSVNAAAIYAACNKYFDHTFNTRENISRKATCNGYFFGVASTLLSIGKDKTSLCMDASISTEQTIRDFLDWAKTRTDLSDIFATQGVFLALQEKYKCK